MNSPRHPPPKEDEAASEAGEEDPGASLGETPIAQAIRGEERASEQQRERASERQRQGGMGSTRLPSAPRKATH